jgi:hypothetical protein
MMVLTQKAIEKFVKPASIFLEMSDVDFCDARVFAIQHVTGYVIDS